MHFIVRLCSFKIITTKATCHKRLNEKAQQNIMLVFFLFCIDEQQNTGKCSDWLDMKKEGTEDTETAVSCIIIFF